MTATAGNASNDDGGIGIMNAAFPNNSSWIGYSVGSLGFAYGNEYSYCCATQWWLNWPGVTVSSSAPPATSAVNTGIVYMLALDMDTKEFWAGQNGTWYNGGDPGTHANPVATGLSGAVYSGVTFYSYSANAFTANFGASSFQYAVPTGFTAGF